MRQTRTLLAISLLGFVSGTAPILQVVMLTYTVYLYSILIASFWHRRAKRGKWYHPKVSVLIPTHNEQHVIGDTMQTILNQTYLDVELVVIDDASTDRTPTVLKALQAQHPHIKVVTRPLEGVAHGKPAALNDALPHVTGDVIAVFDADTELRPDYIETVVPFMSNEDIAGVQTKVRMYNRNTNLLTAVQDSEFAIFCSIMQQGRDTLRGYCGLGGNGQFVKTQILKEAGAWRMGRLTEDFELALTMLEHGYRIGYVNVPVYQEAVTSLHGLLRQRNRWSQGNIQSTLGHFYEILLDRKISLVTKLDLLYVFTTMVQPLILAVSLIFTTVDLATDPQLMRMSLERLDPYTLLLAASYLPFIIVGHLKGKPEDWWRIPYLLPAYYLYSVITSLLYFFSMAQYALYAVRKQKIHWAKTQHQGKGSSQASTPARMDGPSISHEA